MNLNLDIQVDVYKENERFLELHSKYNKTRDESLLDPMCDIIFHCSANILKSKFGHWWSSDLLLDKAIEMTTLILTRIKNFEKWPNGYVIKNLPTVCKFAVFNVVQNKKHIDDCISYDEHIHAMDYKVLDTYKTAYYTSTSWEDEILDRVDKERVYAKTTNN